MSGYTKLHHSMLHSTVWLEPDNVRLVWITMLLMSDANGEVAASVPGLAAAARVSVEACEEALERLSGPDPHSRTAANEGRRIEKIDGGWELLNYERYRQAASVDDHRTKAAERQRRRRDRLKKSGPSRDKRDVTRDSVTERDRHGSHGPRPPIAEADAEAEADPLIRSDARARVSSTTEEVEPETLTAWKRLVRGYQERYERETRSPWMALAANRKEVDAIARWLDASAVDVEAWLDAWFADEWARTHHWPWKHAAKAPGRFLSPGPTSAVPKDELERLQDEEQAARLRGDQRGVDRARDERRRVAAERRRAARTEPAA